ncbi:MAG: glycosyltransferase family 4 protein [Candidatus Binatia bacterium]
MSERWTWVLPRLPPQYSINDYTRELLFGRLAKRIDPETVWLDYRRPLLSKYAALPAFIRLSRRRGPFHLDAVHLPLLALVRLRRSVVTIYDLCPSLHPELYPCSPPERLDAVLARRGARNVDAIVTVSRFQKEELARPLPFPRERIFAANMSIDHGLYRPAPPEERERLRRELRERHRIAADEALLLHLGNWQPRKNVPGLLRALRRLLDRGRRVRLLIRRYGDLRRIWREPVERAVAELGLDGAIAWLPPLDDPRLRAPLYQAADVLVFPSFYEGFGLPPQEAMGAGCPVVASSAASLPEVVGEAAILVPPGDAEALADAVESVLDDAALRAELVRRGREQVRRFTWDAAIPAHLAAYEVVDSRIRRAR